MKIIFLFFFIIPGSLLAQVNLNSGLVGYWGFNGNANDVSGNNNNGTVYGATLSPGKLGIPNTAYSFNGASNYIEVLNNTALNFPNDSFSIYALVKVQGFYTGICHGNCIVEKGDADYIPGHYSLRFSDAYSSSFINCSSPVNTAQQNYYFQTYSAAIGSPYGQVLPYISTAQWDCIIATSDGDSTRIFVNGTLRQTQAIQNSISTNINNLFFGRKNSLQYPYWFNGIMDEVRLYNRPLNMQEIDSLCNVNGSVASVNSSFQYAYPNPCDSLTIQFNDLSSVISCTITGWHWNFGNGDTSNLQNPLYTYSSSGSYLVTLIVTTNQNTTDTFSLPVQVVFNGINTLITASPGSLCVGQSSSLLATGAISYSWSPSSGLNATNIANPIATPTSTTTYTVIGTDANDCSNTSSITIPVYPLPIIQVHGPSVMCEKDTVQLTVSGASTYQWSPAGTLSASTGSVVQAFPMANTTYTIMGTDIHGCSSSTNYTLTISDTLDINVSKSNDVNCAATSCILTATGATNFTWSPTTYLSAAIGSSVVASAPSTTTFYVTGTSGNCIAYDSITVNYLGNPAPTIFIPNAFSPNYDQLNDCLHVSSSELFAEFSFNIYNRWGQKIYETHDQLNCWEGFFNNQRVPQDTYYYYLKAKNRCGEVFRKGDIVVLR